MATGMTMGRITFAVENVACMVEGIARASAKPASGVAKVSPSVSEMERSMQQNAAMVEAASAATESLRMQSQRLVEWLRRSRIA
jgi:methyl-accepting chemotaxis protein